MLNFRDYLDYAERYHRRAEEKVGSSEGTSWLLIPATVLAFTAIESFVNNRLDDCSEFPENQFELHEKAFLLEQKLRFMERGNNAGCFVLEGTEYRRLEDKIFFLIAKFGAGSAKGMRGQSLWQDFEEFKDVRNGLVHPRRGTEIRLSVDRVGDYIEVAKAIIQMLSRHIWGRDISL